MITLTEQAAGMASTGLATTSHKSSRPMSLHFQSGSICGQMMTAIFTRNLARSTCNPKCYLLPFPLANFFKELTLTEIFLVIIRFGTQKTACSMGDGGTAMMELLRRGCLALLNFGGSVIP
eukprot:GHVO01026064.1.p2 GENE.GHVO01026064.1~~GHVO01026064.1.p2  ORF type:complete len:121 (+),score=0.36 GHVO01026064.1:340-702(+)